MRMSSGLATPLQEQNDRPIRVLLVDDSNVVRSIFARMLSDSGEIEVVGEAGNSEEALKLLKTIRPDIILLDIEMPERSGLDALPDILDAAGGGRVLVVSSFVEENGPAAIRALELGACDTLSKPGRFGFAGRFPELLVEKVVRLGSSSRLVARKNSAPENAIPIFDSKFEISVPDCIAIGASTGGIPVIYEIVRNLPVELNCPVFIAQHLPDAFMEFFARQLSAHTDRTVCVPKPGTEIAERTIYISPGSAHLTCAQNGRRRKIEHLDYYPSSRYSPSVDALFESVAQVYGSGALAIVLSGMGNDGAAGAVRLSAAGANVIVQDAESSGVWGMPGAVAKAGLADAILPPPLMSRLLARAVQQ
ncbi:chemotaxis-specific protein-glutamate methyltransferase CheB [uncultured Sphingorhabdus sp.]|uniref:chemotaxis-specific protein-glutamate methyltransferase CheB n=1 Tax=uncultured Sphingorhabdus sp. TaxID=1686106 RepID=UPI0026038135|nr:chemotaxis-specific protein-glutamate methyltransferase CheB [uncultured Sphingorhabdus sp.]HMS20903.1 chemotaxis-specific protein-glutamate methyltransferase CheB [Sphingorhabdus sp.]